MIDSIVSGGGILLRAPVNACREPPIILALRLQDKASVSAGSVLWPASFLAHHG